MKKLLQFALLFALAAGSTACLTSREIITATDHSTNGLTLVETVDTYFPFRFPDGGREIYRFWECKDEGDQMVCRLACDGAGQAKCPHNGASVGADVIR